MVRAALAMSLALVVCPAFAQPGPPAGEAAGSGDGSPADQVVGLFGATCLHFAGDVAGLRGFLQQQQAPQMPQAARDAFLAGRHGQVYDVSYQTVKLALVSIDDGTCEAAAEQADPRAVVSLLQEASRQNGVALNALGGQADKDPRGVQHSAFGVTLAGKPMHILVSTAAAAPQAVLTLVPR